MSKFKVGDIVKCIRYRDMVVNKGLKLGRITKLTSAYTTIKILEHDNIHYCNKYVMCKFPERDDYFELIEIDVKSLYPYSVQPNFKLPPELEHEWEKLVRNSYTGSIGDLCGKNLFDGAIIRDDFYDKYIKGVWEKEEEKEMNKVLNLWYTRKKSDIYKKYKGELK